MKYSGGRAALVASLICRLAAQADGQALTGQITDSASRAPITGAVVLGLDAGGRTVGRTVSNDRGAYRLALRGTERSIRVVRIGFRPISRSTIHSGERLDIAMA